MTNKRRNRKVRRNMRKVLRFGREAAPPHKSKSGRTGNAHSRKLRSVRAWKVERHEAREVLDGLLAARPEVP